MRIEIQRAKPDKFRVASVERDTVDILVDDIPTYQGAMAAARAFSFEYSAPIVNRVEDKTRHAPRSDAKWSQFV